MSNITDTLTRWLEPLTDIAHRWAVRRATEPLWDGFSSCGLNSAGLTQDTAKVKIGASDFYAIANGVLVKVAAATDMAALVGTVVNATFNVFSFFVDSGGTLHTYMGQPAATLGGVMFPQFPKNYAMIGFVIINPTGTGNFVGGTTSLSDGTVVPNAAYVNSEGPWNPYALIGGG